MLFQLTVGLQTARGEFNNMHQTNVHLLKDVEGDFPGVIEGSVG
jgi:hypothetical protein